jgi:hypothetical protein
VGQGPVDVLLDHHVDLHLLAKREQVADVGEQSLGRLCEIAVVGREAKDRLLA